MTSRTDPLGRTTTFTYTAKGQMETTTDPLGNVTRMEYNASGDLIKTTDPLGKAVNASFDLAGRSTSTTNPLGLTSAMRYDNNDRIDEITDPMQGKTTTTFSPARDPASVTDARGHVIERTVHDLRHRVIERSDAFNAKSSFRYDNLGNLIGTTDRKGQVFGIEYDERARIFRSRTADGAVTDYIYDAQGRIAQFTEMGGVVNTRKAYTYDLADRVTRIDVTSGPLNYSLSYRYDTLNRILARTLDYRNQVETTEYGYDKVGNLTTISYRGKQTWYEYDAAYRLTKKTLPNGLIQTYEYDGASRLTRITYQKPDSQNAGQLITIDTIDYRYDAADRQTLRASSTNLIATVPETPTATSYDAGNREQTITLKGTGPNIDDKIFALTFDANGNLTSKVGGEEVTIYTWDPRNRLVRLSRSGGSTGTVLAEFTYDAQNRRIERTLAIGSNPLETTRFVFEGLQVIAETKIVGALSETTYILNGPGIDEIIARYSDASTRIALTDGLGSVLALSSENQTLATQYSYSPHGETSETGELSANSNQYTARENDRTGLYYYRARYYDPVIKRFISEDPIGLLGGINVRSYVNGNPISFVDPLGLAIYRRGNTFSDTRPGEGCETPIWSGGYIVGWKPCPPPEEVCRLDDGPSPEGPPRDTPPPLPPPPPPDTPPPPDPPEPDLGPVVPKKPIGECENAIAGCTHAAAECRSKMPKHPGHKLAECAYMALKCSLAAYKCKS